MTVYRYPLRSLVGDYLRASVGVTIGLGVLLSVPGSPVVLVIFGSLTILFLAFGLRTIQRHVVQVGLSEDEIRSAGFTTRVLPWSELERLELRYYGTRRRRARGDSGAGFLQLELRGAGASLTLESSIDGFERIAAQASRAARDNGVRLDPVSAGNLLDLGLDPDAAPPED